MTVQVMQFQPCEEEEENRAGPSPVQCGELTLTTITVPASDATSSGWLAQLAAVTFN